MLFDSRRHKVILNTSTKNGWEGEGYGSHQATVGYTDRDHRASWKRSGKGWASADITVNKNDGSISLDITETAETGATKRVMLDLPPEIVQAIKKAIG